MKGLSIGRAELVSRFVSKERQRLSRSMESSLFAAEMQQERRRLAAPLFNSPQVPLRARPQTAALQALHGGSAVSSRRIIGGDTAEKPHLEIADPLLIQEILALFHVTADQTKKAATLTGDEGALALQELIAMLEQGTSTSLEDLGQEQVSADEFRKLLQALRWSDNKHKAVPNADHLALAAVYDREGLVETLKNLLTEAEAQHTALQNAQAQSTSLSPANDQGNSAEVFGPPGMVNATEEDFMAVSKPTPFSLWSTSKDPETALASIQEPPREREATDGQKKPGSATHPFIGPESLEDHEGNGMKAFHNDSSTAEMMPISAPAWATEISPRAPQTLAQNLGFPQHGVSQPWNALFTFADSLNLKASSEPETFSIQTEPVVGNQANQHVFAAQGSSTHERSSGSLENTVTLHENQPAAWPIFSSNAFGESWEDASQPLDMLPEEAAQDLLEAKLVFMGRDFNSLHSSGGDSAPFGDSSQPFQENFPHSSAQQSFGAAVYSPSSAPSTVHNKAAEPAATLSLEHAQWPQELGHKLSLLSRSGKNFMTLELQPESLGKLIVRVETHGTHVSALVQTEHPVVREILQSNMASLRDVLADQGLQLSHFSVDVRNSNTPFSRGNDTLWEPKAQWASATVSFQEKPEETLNPLHVMDGDLAGILSVRV